MSSTNPPLNLADVPTVDDALIDPELANAAAHYFASHAVAATGHDGSDEVHLGVVDIDNEKFDLAAAAVAAAHAHNAVHHPELLAGVDVDVGNINVHVGGIGVDVGPTMTGEDLNSSAATPGPGTHVAPFSRPLRGEGTPHPENMLFVNRAEFEVWFEGEDSWCHFVQRRTTTPEKRAEERLRARIKAHERMLADMAPEEAASVAPLKRRRRNRTSTIKEKVTYTCHHAGRYDPKHSTTLPREKLRLNTKKSVKCDCSARIVLTEMEEGECKVSYFWQHEGHDAYADDELESGRLPKVIDEWLVAQIHAGKDTDEIRRSLMMTDDEKQAYLSQIAEDPSAVDPDKPPALALTLRIKYPDIYNRYRKLKGPIKEFKPPKNPRGSVPGTASATATPGTSRKRASPESDEIKSDTLVSSHPSPYPPAHPSHDVVDSTTFALDDAMNGAELTFTDGELAHALLTLPQGHADADHDLGDAVLHMANGADATGGEGDLHKDHWDDVTI